MGPLLLRSTKHSASLSSYKWGHSPPRSSSTEWELWNGESLPNRCSCSVLQSGLTLCDPMGCNTPGFPVHHQRPELAQTHVHWAGDAIQLILCHLFLLPSIFPSIRVFFNESGLCIRWPKYWSFSFSISPSNEYSGFISLRIDWFDLLTVQGTLKSLLQHHNSKASVLQCSAFFMVQFPVHT